MTRRLFNFGSALSLLLCLATVALWARSYWFYDSVTLPLPHPWAWVQLDQVRGHAQLWLHTAGPRSNPTGLESDKLETLEPQWPPSDTTDLMFHPPPFEFRYIDASHNGVIIRFYLLGLPHWLLVGFFAISPVLLTLSRLRASGRGHRNLCGTCGYDLRASTDRCPECGTAFPQKAEAAT